MLNISKDLLILYEYKVTKIVQSGKLNFLTLFNELEKYKNKYIFVNNKLRQSLQ